jgi:redox-sensitive bicupin YhaK (pirin superfamily)
MITLRRADERGHFDHGWLNTFHTFSFADYYDPDHMGFRSLRVINDDRVAPGEGFPTHGHRDMEIVTYVLEGELQHKDSMGNGSIIRPGEVQRMTAGTGVRHSEFNPSKENWLHLLQIWILPVRQNLAPGYEQKNFSEEERQGKLKLVASPDGREGSVTIHQDANLYVSLLDGKAALDYELKSGRNAWVHVAKGSLELNGERLNAGDGAAIADERALKFSAGKKAEFLLFDLG